MRNITKLSLSVVWPWSVRTVGDHMVGSMNFRHILRSLALWALIKWVKAHGLWLACLAVCVFSSVHNQLCCHARLLLARVPACPQFLLTTEQGILGYLSGFDVVQTPWMLLKCVEDSSSLEISWVRLPVCNAHVCIACTSNVSVYFSLLWSVKPCLSWFHARTLLTRSSSELPATEALYPSLNRKNGLFTSSHLFFGHIIWAKQRAKYRPLI